MSAGVFPRRSVLLGMVAISLLGWSLRGGGQEKDVKASEIEKNKTGQGNRLEKRFFSFVTCIDCHRSGTPAGAPERLCRCIEVPLWNTKDKHQDAYNVLLPKNERAKRMGEILKISPESEASCLSCHSMFAKGDAKYKEAGLLAEGVSCVACHGAFEAWFDPHGSSDPVKRKNWREKTRNEKQDQFGMTDLWHAETRTKICSSCHIGDTEKGRVITHEMYAAGHPPLSGFETATFSEGMPMHWQLLREKSPKIQELLNYSEQKDGLEQTRIVIIGNVAAFRESMRLLASQAEACVQAKDAAKQILDMAQFDCAQCHHDLKRKSWRQERGYKTTPGRPQFRPFSTALLQVAIGHAGGSDREVDVLKAKIEALYKAFSTKPFGESKEVARIANELAEWSSSLAQKLNHDPARYDKAAALGLLKRIAEIPSKEVPDYDSARQIAWSFRAIYYELIGAPTESKQPGDGSVRNKLALEREAMAKHIMDLEKGLLLKLPLTDEANENKEYPTDEARRAALLSEYTQQRQAKYDKFWPENLVKQGDYGPDEFRKTFSAIAKLFPK